MKVNKNPEYFLTVAAEGSISKAAEKLFISQPYLSQWIIRLEESFGVRLFDRSKTPLTLTEAGEIYVRYLESGNQLYEKLLLDFAALNESRSRTLRMGFGNWRASTLLPDILPEFTKLYPDVHLEIYEQPTNELYRLVQENKVDFVVMNTTFDSPDYVTTETVMYEKILLAGHRENPITQRFLELQERGEPLDLHLLGNERMLLLRPEIILASRVNNYLDKNGIVFRNVTYTMNATTALNLTAQNCGFCFLNETGVRSAPNLEKLAFFDLKSQDLVHPLCLVYRKNSYLAPIARAFIDTMLSFYREEERGSGQQA